MLLLFCGYFSLLVSFFNAQDVTDSAVTTNVTTGNTEVNSIPHFRITSVEKNCTSFIITAEVEKTLQKNLTWRVQDNRKFISLVKISEKDPNETTVAKVPNSLIQASDYDVLYGSDIDNMKQSIEIRLVVTKLKFNDTLWFELTAPTSSITDRVNVTPLACSYPFDHYCKRNCLNQTVCASQFVKLCQDGRRITQDCPDDVTKAEFKKCQRGFEIDPSRPAYPVFYVMVLMAIFCVFLAVSLLCCGYMLGYLKDSEELFEVKYKLWTSVLVLFGSAVTLVGFGMAYGLPRHQSSMGLFLIIAGGAMLTFAGFAGSYIIVWNQKKGLHESLSNLDTNKSEVRRHPLPQYLPPYFN